MPLVFGTDGVRGRANDELTPEVAVAFGRAVVRILGVRDAGRGLRHAPQQLDARGSGLRRRRLGGRGRPRPRRAADAGRRGALRRATTRPGSWCRPRTTPSPTTASRCSTAPGASSTWRVEAAIEHAFTSLRESPHDPGRPVGRGVGSVRAVDDARSWYERQLLAAAGGTRLDGLRLVVDCANGAASGIAPAVFAALGADVTAIGDEPDGCNINDKVGSTAPQALADAVVAAGADLGIAVDGDADRCIAVDGTGRVLDGDWLLALFATDRSAAGTLGGGVVVTVMSNLGLHRTLRDAGIDVVEVPVGDRHVAEALARTGWALGGEQSGHLVFADRAATGDGMLTGLMLAQLVATRGPLHVLTDGLLTVVPQVLVNVKVADASALGDAAALWADVAGAERELGDRGRVLLRASGTEPLVRLMVEAEDEALLHRIVEQLRSSVLDALGSSADHG